MALVLMQGLPMMWLVVLVSALDVDNDRLIFPPATDIALSMMALPSLLAVEYIE
jgi:hypothetical protein